MNSYAIHERASDKAFAKITMLKIEAEQLNDDIKLGITGPITIEELELMYAGTLLELQTWRYIIELIEKSNKNG